jgi:hypothetical protein
MITVKTLLAFRVGAIALGGALFLIALTNLPANASPPHQFSKIVMGISIFTLE